MSEVLLIHGACFGAWCWDGVIAALAQRGVQARAIDLPGRGGPASLDDQARAIAAALSGPAVLVGHSAGGFAITAAAEISPHVAGLIYLCAYVPVVGMSLAQMRRAGPSQPMAGAFEVAGDQFGFRADRARALFFEDCEDATAQLVMQAIAPMETPLTTDARAQSLPRGAIICQNDRAIPPDYQRQMAAGMLQHEIAMGNAPFLAEPEVLAAELIAMARQILSVAG
ncbi:MAG: alpha/beta fold hydrolase [Cypionkella sp.]